MKVQQFGEVAVLKFDSIDEAKLHAQNILNMVDDGGCYATAPQGVTEAEMEAAIQMMIAGGYAWN